ncbi:predicted protein [Uncinocarpus reesii 1704]|uniref:Uncharacterized protein n=1 Tax=Uncinocarpus reesii (strain UAMH 1704) TaxID=336963 RepID=C4JMS6_UNCRE|nr:uncharacterized protein UREG_04134 [Uncinocarpus reesii 1704]EEP79288.1 predicted protein [Uncinocarpus reesii 1704]
MGITWDKAAIERIIAALLASHPGFTPDYRAMAVYFGQGATYDSIQYRFREYRKMAEAMTEGSPTSSRRGPNTPRTPRTTTSTTTTTPRTNTRGGVAKPAAKATPKTPSKHATPSKMRGGASAGDSIILDDDDDLFVKAEPSTLSRNPGLKIEQGSQHGFGIFSIKQEGESTETTTTIARAQESRQARAETVVDSQHGSTNIDDLFEDFEEVV